MAQPISPVDFIEDPADYVGSHRYTAMPVFERCKCEPNCIALIGSDQNPRPFWWEYGERHAAPVTASVVEPRHGYTVPGYPYLVYVSGIRVEVTR